MPGPAFQYAETEVNGGACVGFREADENYMERLKLSLCTLIGVLLTVLVAVVLFPIRARTKLRQRTAEVLERMGNLAFYLMGEFCEVSPSCQHPAPHPLQPVGWTACEKPQST